MTAKSKQKLTQASILSGAVSHRNGVVLPLPNCEDLTSPTIAKLLKRMLNAGLVSERPTKSQSLSWRADDSGKLYALQITDEGRAACASAAEEPTSNESDGNAAAPADIGVVPLPRGKLGQVLAAVKHADGATIGDLTSLTGWQAHTVRASLTRLRQCGTPINLIEQSGIKRYVALAPGAAQ